MTKDKKIFLFASVGLLTLGGIGTGIGFSISGFSATEKNTQLVGVSGENDVQKKSIFLNANIWNVSTPLYYLYAFDSSGTNSAIWVQSSRTIAPTISSTTFSLTVFVYDTTKYDRFLFARINPDGTNIPRFNEVGETGDDRPCWNQTNNITFSESINYYCIEGWSDASNSNSSYKTNTLSLNGSGNLYFSGSESSLITT